MPAGHIDDCANGRKIVGADDSSEAAGGGDRLQTRDAGSENEHLGGSEGPGGGGKHREHVRRGGGAVEYGTIAGGGCHRGEGVHRLSSRDAGHQFHGQERDPGCGDVSSFVNGGEGFREADDDLAFA